MVPKWLISVASLTPILILAAIALVVFGIYRIWVYQAKQKEAKSDEEAQRQKFLESLSVKIKNKSTPKGPPDNTLQPPRLP